MDTRPPRPSEDALKDLPAGEVYWLVLDPIWDDLDIYEQPLAAFEAVHENQRYLIALHTFSSEFDDGGLQQFIDNESGLLAPEAVKGFELVELPAAAAALQEAIAMFGERYPRDQEERQELLCELEESAGDDGDPFAAQEARLHEILAAHPLDEHLDTFVASHLELFFREP